MIGSPEIRTKGIPSEKMNQGIWRILEDKVRDWAKSRGEIYIYTGPVYDGKEELKVIGKNKVAVPSSLFKIVFSPGDH